MQNIFAQVISSKKYSGISKDTILRICVEEEKKYKKEKDIIKAVKNRLHQITGMFFDGKQHASSKERMNFYMELYNDIFTVCGEAETILDIACGLNPIYITEYFKEKNIPFKKIFAEDINEDSLKLVKEYFINNSIKGEVRVNDIMLNLPTKKADIALLFKIIPLLEQQKKGYFKEVISRLNAEYIVVSFPTKTISGKSVGMKENYSNLFENFIEEYKYKLLFKKEYNNELVYIISLTR